MGNRSIAGYAVVIAAIDQLAGGDDETVIARAERCEEAIKELDDFFAFVDPPTTTVGVLREVLAGRLDPERATEYRRLLELLGAAIGRRLEPTGMVVPGYGLEDLGRPLVHLGLPTLGAAWSACQLRFPWRHDIGHPDANWPKAIVIEPSELSSVAAELKTFSPSMLANVPLSDDSAVNDFFTEPGQVLADPKDPHLPWLLTGVAQWVEAVTPPESLMLIIDGDR